MASSAAGPTEAVPASTGRKRPRTDAGPQESVRRVLIYTTCYNVIDG